MSLDQFITAVTTLSSQANYAELCDHLNKSQEVALNTTKWKFLDPSPITIHLSYSGDLMFPIVCRFCSVTPGSWTGC